MRQRWAAVCWARSAVAVAAAVAAATTTKRSEGSGWESESPRAFPSEDQDAMRRAPSRA